MRLIDVEPLECVVSITPKGVDAKSYNDGFTDALELMDKQPTIDAVPLDKLCEWLADELHVSADCGIDHCDNCDAYDGTVSVKGCWMKLIKEQVMEAPNGTDNP